jgi:hypothetical protein
MLEMMAVGQGAAIADSPALDAIASAWETIRQDMRGASV